MIMDIPLLTCPCSAIFIHFVDREPEYGFFCDEITKTSKKFLMLLHQGLIHQLLAEGSAGAPIDAATIVAFSEEVERFVVSLISKLKPESSDSGAGDVEELEESLLKELEGDSAPLSGMIITAHDVQRL